MMITQEKKLLKIFEILELPKHLQITTAALMKLGRATADETSKITGKARALESSYLNQLVTLKMCKKQRSGRKTVFSIREAFAW